MLAIAAAAQERSLAAYTRAVEKYAEHLTEDHIIAYHLRDLREDMMEKNLTRYTLHSHILNILSVHYLLTSLLYSGLLSPTAGSI